MNQANEYMFHSEEIQEKQEEATPVVENEEIDLKQIAQTTAGFTGADLENLMNEAAIHAAMEDRSFVVQEDIEKDLREYGATYVMSIGFLD